MANIIAFMFIGQTPRPDVMDDVRASLGEDIIALEYGALDGLDREEIAKLKPESDKDTLITKLQDGTEVHVSGAAVEKLLEKQIAKAEKDGAQLCAIMCTGSFRISSKGPVITADQAFHGKNSLGPARSIGVIVPLKEQQDTFAGHYDGSGHNIIMGSADPYGNTEDIIAEARRLADAGADMIRLDCMGYTAAQASAARAAAGLPVITPRIEIIRLIQTQRIE